MVFSYSSICIYWEWPERLQKLQIAVILVSACVINIVIGSIYNFGNVQPYITSYIRERSAPHDLRSAQSTYMFAGQNAFFSIGFILGSFGENVIGPRMSLLLGGCLAGVGQCLSMVTIKYSFWLLMLTFGLVYGFGTGIMYIASITCVMRWVPKWAGISIGIVTGGIGAGTLIFSSFQTGFINPHNKHPDHIPYLNHPNEAYFSQASLLDKVPYAFLIQGAFILVVIPICSLPMARPMPTVTDSEPNGAGSVQKSTSEGSMNCGLKPREMITRLDFYFPWIMSTLSCMEFGIISSLFKTYGLEVVGMSDHILTVTGVIAGISGVVGRVFYGLLADRIDCKFSLVTASTLMGVFIQTLYVTSWFRWSALYLVWISAIFLNYGGLISLFNVVVLRYFGGKYLNANSAVACTSRILGSTLAGIVSDSCLYWMDWYGMFLLLGGLSCVSFIAALMLSNNRTRLYG